MTGVVCVGDPLHQIAVGRQAAVRGGGGSGVIRSVANKGSAAGCQMMRLITVTRVTVMRAGASRLGQQGAAMGMAW
ncbi:hypothetical protein TSO5_19665 [Azospirillum sp. TSO5]|nr:hypothetical protein TSO5_19665 [Azospirillum sp. TSO5]